MAPSLYVLAAPGLYVLAALVPGPTPAKIKNKCSKCTLIQYQVSNLNFLISCTVYCTVPNIGSLALKVANFPSTMLKNLFLKIRVILINMISL